MGTTLRKLTAVVCVSALAALGVVLISAGSAAAAPIPLVLPQTAAFSVLGYSCGGIQEKTYATQFDPTSGYPDGAVYLTTTCSAGGKGGHSTTLTAWAYVTWDFTGAVVSFGALSPAPSVDPTLTAFDSHGNEIYNSSNNAYLVLAAGFVPTPRVTGMSPMFGPASGGTSVTITGTGFSGVNPAVSFGGTPAATFTVNSDTSITAVSPQEAAGTVHVTVTTAGGTDTTSGIDQFTFYATPSVTSIGPTTGPVNGGTAVTITGMHFLGATAVSFGDTQAGFVVDSDTSITAYAPGEGNPDTVSVTVTSPGGTSSPTSLDTYTYANVASGTPAAPTGVTAVAGDGSATVSFTAPTSDGGSPINSYTVVATDTSNAANGGRSASGPSTPITVTSLMNGDSYTFAVTASNVNGPGSTSGPSNPVVPRSAASPALAIVTTALPNATRGVSYRVTLQAMGGATRHRWKALGGLPPGFKLRSNGLLLGKPTIKRTPAGQYAVRVEVTTKMTRTSTSQRATQVLTLLVT